MSRELLIVSDSAEFASTLGIALTQRGAWRVSLAGDVEAALQAKPRGTVLLDSEEADAGRLVSRQLHEFGTDVAVHSISRSAGLAASLALLEPPAEAPAEAPLEPLGGDESDARFWRYVTEPEFLRNFRVEAEADTAADSVDGLRQEDGSQKEADAGPVDDGGLPGREAAEPPAAVDLTGLLRETGARLALLQRDGAEIASAGQVDDAALASLRAQGAGGATTQLHLVSVAGKDEPDLLFITGTGPLQLSLLVADDVPVRSLRRACAAFLADLG